MTAHDAGNKKGQGIERVGKRLLIELARLPCHENAADIAKEHREQDGCA